MSVHIGTCNKLSIVPYIREPFSKNLFIRRAWREMFFDMEAHDECHICIMTECTRGVLNGQV